MIAIEEAEPLLENDKAAQSSSDEDQIIEESKKLNFIEEDGLHSHDNTDQSPINNNPLKRSLKQEAFFGNTDLQAEDTLFFGQGRQSFSQSSSKKNKLSDAGG